MRMAARRERGRGREGGRPGRAGGGAARPRPALRRRRRRRRVGRPRAGPAPRGAARPPEHAGGRVPHAHGTDPCRLNLRRRPPLRFGRLLLASLGNASTLAAVRRPSRTHRVRDLRPLRRQPPLRFGWLLLASLGNPRSSLRCAGPAGRTGFRHPPLRFGWLLLASLGNASRLAALGSAVDRRCGAPARAGRTGPAWDLDREHPRGAPRGRVPRRQLPTAVAGDDRHRVLHAALLPGRHGPRPRLADQPERVVVGQPRRAQLRGLPRPGAAGRQRHDHRLARQHLAGARRDAVEPHLLRHDVDAAPRGRPGRRATSSG